MPKMGCVEKCTLPSMAIVEYHSDESEIIKLKERIAEI
jgi:hypothetical protein